MTREQALDRYLDLITQMKVMAQEASNLRKHVLGEVIAPQRQPMNRVVSGHTKSIPRGSQEQAVVTILSEHGGSLRATEITALMGNGARRNAITQTLGRLAEKGMVHKDKSGGNATAPVLWSLAIHKDESLNNDH